MLLVFEIDPGAGFRFRFTRDLSDRAQRILPFIQQFTPVIPSWEPNPETYPQPKPPAAESVAQFAGGTICGFLDEDAIISLSLPLADVARVAKGKRWGGERVRALVVE